jgi:serine/threonine protein kinase/DNA-binding SARP family transcriptional activator
MGSGVDRDSAAELETRLNEELGPDLQIVRLLGSGSMAYVYLAREPALKRLVAVKVLTPRRAREEKARLRFQREAQSAARISHPNVVPVHRVGALSDGTPYLVMAYVKGRTMAQRLVAQGMLPVDEACGIVAQIGSALAAAHRKGLVHRDVKPGNVLFEEDTGRVLLSDFGIVAILTTGEDDAARITTTGHVVGDLAYTSPELLLDDEVTERSDVYGLAILAYELLTGEGPYGALSAREAAVAHIRAEPRRLREVRPDVDPSIEDLLLRCLAKTPEHRPTALDVAAILEPFARIGSEPSGAWQASILSATGRMPARLVTASGSGAPLVDGPPSAGGPPVTADVSPTAAAGADPRGTVSESSAMQAPRGTIAFRTLGSLDLTGSDSHRILSVIAQPKRVALLAYLAVGGGFKRRDTLIGVFWPELDQDRARHALRQATYVLRGALGPEVIVSRGDDELGVDEEKLWCDAIAFEAAADAGRAEVALSLYAGELLPGFFLTGAGNFQAWLEGERARLRRCAADQAWALAGAAERDGNAVGATYWARQAVELSPFDEAALCRLLELLDRAGDRAGAIHSYEQFARRLEQRYASEPAPETVELMEQIRSRAASD